jgi:hypothetical protein
MDGFADGQVEVVDAYVCLVEFVCVFMFAEVLGCEDEGFVGFMGAFGAGAFVGARVVQIAL